MNDIFDDGDMVTVGFIISKPHHSPSRQHRVPVNFNDAIINLFSRSFEPNNPKRQEEELVTCRESELDKTFARNEI